MPKRFADTELWSKEWFMNLAPAEKCAFQYIAAKCDNVGVWSPNYRLAEFVIGSEIAWLELPEKINSNVVILDSGKWWLTDFCRFQYGDLTPDCRPHKSYIELLKKHGLWDAFLKGIDRVSVPLAKGTRKGKELDKDKEKEQEKEKKLDPNFNYLPLASLLLTLHRELDPGFWKNKRDEDFIENGADAFRLLIERDKRPYKLVENILRWSKSEGNWWCPQIQSGAGFRRNFPKIYAQYKRETTKEESEMIKQGWTLEEDIAL